MLALEAWGAMIALYVCYIIDDTMRGNLLNIWKICKGIFEFVYKSFYR